MCEWIMKANIFDNLAFKLLFRTVLGVTVIGLGFVFGIYGKKEEIA